MSGQLALSQSQAQHLIITPHLQQSLKILQAGRLELLKIIETELLENPTLEPLDEDSSEQKEEDVVPIHVRGPSYQSKSDSRVSKESASTVTLQQHLLSQLSPSQMPSIDYLLLYFLIHNLNDSGFLELSDAEVSRTTGASPLHVGKCVRMLQSLDPIGVGARSLQDCLLLQLLDRGAGRSLEAKIVREHSKLLAEGKIEKICQLEGVHIRQVMRSLRRLRVLNPSPGSRYSQDCAPAVVPDVIVRKYDGRYIAIVNEATHAKCSVSSYCKNLFASTKDRSTRNYLKERLSAAKWLVQCLQQRHETLRRISQVIVDHEVPFFEEGIERLKPIYLKEVAQEIGMHESTVSRAVANKYIETPYGIYELKYFCTSRIKTSRGEVSSRLVKETIRTLIEREDRIHPLSDYALAEVFMETDVKIARRTITNYRVEMGIPAAALRRIQAMASDGQCLSEATGMSIA